MKLLKQIVQYVAKTEAKLLNVEAKVDYAYGAVFGALMVLVGAGWHTLPLILICSVLWAVGGDKKYKKLWRRAGCALATAGVLAVVHQDVSFMFAGLAVFGILSLGYGLPDPPDRVAPDPGSAVGFVALELANHNYKLATIYARGTIMGLCVAVYSMASFLNWLSR